MMRIKHQIHSKQSVSINVDGHDCHIAVILTVIPTFPLGSLVPRQVE